MPGTGDHGTNKRGKNLLADWIRRQNIKNLKLPGPTFSRRGKGSSIVDYIMFRNVQVSDDVCSFIQIPRPIQSDHQMISATFQLENRRLDNEASDDPEIWYWRRTWLNRKHHLKRARIKLRQIKEPMKALMNDALSRDFEDWNQEQMDEFYAKVCTKLKTTFKGFLYAKYEKHSQLVNRVTFQPFKRNHDVLKEVKSRLQAQRHKNNTEVTAASALDIESVKAHYEQVFHADDPPPDLPRASIPIFWTQSCVEFAIKKLHNRRAIGSDDIPCELLKADKKSTCVWLDLLFRVFHRAGLVPSCWRHAKITLVFKKGDPKLPKNYRPIAVLSHIRKLYEIVMEMEFMKRVQKPHVMQAGFQPNRSCYDQIVVLDEAIQTFKAKAALIDIEKAFDTVDRSILWRKLEERGANDSMIYMLKLLFDNTIARFQLPGGQCDVGLERGLLQGTVLSPQEFVAFIDDAIPTINEAGNSPLMLDQNVGSLYLADDGAMLDLTDMQPKCDAIEQHSRDNRYKANPTKSYYLDRDAQNPTPTIYDNEMQRLSDEDTTAYLGVLFKISGMAIKESLDKYCKRTSAAAGELKRCESFRWEIHLGQMANIIKAFVRNSLEYGLAIMPLTLKQKNELDKTLAKAVAEVLDFKRVGCTATLLHELGLESYEVRHPRLVLGVLEKWRNSDADIVPKLLLNDVLNGRSKGTRMKKLMRTVPYYLEAFTREYDALLNPIEQREYLDAYFDYLRCEYESKQATKFVTFIKPHYNRPEISPLYMFVSKNNQRALLRWRVDGYWVKSSSVRACLKCRSALSRTHLYECSEIDQLIDATFKRDYTISNAPVAGGQWTDNEKVALEPIMYTAQLRRRQAWSAEKCLEYYKPYDDFLTEAFRRFNEKLYQARSL
jgi:hypothetical protein